MRCPFHLSSAERRAADVSPADLRAAFQADLRAETARRREYAGVDLGDGLDLSSLVIDADDLSRIQFRDVTCDGTLSVAGSVLRHPVDFVDCSLAALDLTDATVVEDLTVRDCRLGVETTSVTCLTARKTSFEASLRLERTELFGSAEFAASAVDGWLDVDRVDVRGRFHAPNARLQMAQFVDCSFGDVVEFVGTTAEHLTFEQTRFDVDPTLEETTLETIRCHPAGDVEWSFREATLRSGRLLQPPDGVACYDLSDATVGAVDLDCSAATFNRYRFVRTRFEGFHFAAYRTLFQETGWDLDSYVARPRPEASDRELTYLEAKRGATASGDNESAAAFFVREMRARRTRYGGRARDRSLGVADRVDAATRWLTNGFLDAVSGYGELPERTVAVALAVMLGAALLYPALGIVTTGGPVSYATAGPTAVVDGLYFSVVTFTTLGLGDVRPLTVAGRLLAGSEALSGAFLTALFVFALGRRVTR